MRITVLGSGGTLPTLTRNLPALALRREGEIMLFDCGEGTQLQLMRARVGFGPISSLFISHLHGDHVTGIPGLLMTLGQSARQEPLRIYGPRGIERYVRGIMDYITIHPAYEVQIREIGDKMIFDGRGYLVEATAADHNVLSLAYAFIEAQRPGRFDADKARQIGIPEGPLYRDLQRGRDVRLCDGRTVRAGEIVGPPRPGRKFVYAADTRPCSAVVDLARGADLLIHDSMFAEEMKQEAAQRGHSTARQAAEVACQAGVKRLVLAHISPRYEDDTLLLQEAQAVFPQTIVARDLMSIDIPVHK